MKASHLSLCQIVNRLIIVALLQQLCKSGTLYSLESLSLSLGNKLVT
jgi:hypothetical protein